jgi:hypothetical protein
MSNGTNLLLICVILLAALSSCRDDDPSCLSCPPAGSRISLDSVFIDPTDIHLQLTWNAPGSVSIRRNGVEFFRRSGESIPETTSVIDSLLRPHQLYYYRAYLINKNNLPYDSSAMLSVSTLDTTLNDFLWTVDTLGEGNHSILRDVSIINDTLVYAVGEFYQRDSTGNFDPTPFNVAIWNGRRWQMDKIEVLLCGTSSTIIVPMTAVLCFSPNDVWISSGGTIERWDGISWHHDCTMNSLIKGEILKMWGNSSSNIYAVGRNGTVIHYDGVSWHAQESGTTIDLLDVYGSPNGSSIWACGYDNCCPGTYLIRNTGSGWGLAYDGSASEFRILDDSLSGTYSSVFTTNANRVSIGSSTGIYIAPGTTRGEGKRYSFTSTYFPGFPVCLRGNGFNDLTVVGAYNFIAHFNGVNWRYFDALRANDGIIHSVYQRGNFVVAVGQTIDPINSKGIVFRGKR